LLLADTFLYTDYDGKAMAGNSGLGKSRAHRRNTGL
jgi:hypothetical protein